MPRIAPQVVEKIETALIAASFFPTVDIPDIAQRSCPGVVMLHA
jgi:hypothetical protein